MNEHVSDEDAGAQFDHAEDAPSAPSLQPVSGVDPVSCRGCGYDIRGLSSDGVCPECGFPVQRSLGSDHLHNSSPEYVTKLDRGVTITFGVVAAMIIFWAISMISLVSYMIATSGGAPARWVEFVLEGASSVLSLALIYGWWLLSEPDPAFTGRADGSKARRIVRVMLFVAAGTNLISLTLAVVPESQATEILAAVVGVLAFGVFATRYFAEILYLQWLAGRIPDWDAHKSSKRLLWLGPVLFVVGAFCFGMGPLIAMILYMVLLNTIRNDIKNVRQAMRGP